MADSANVLIVDDNQDLRETLAVLLESEGHHVSEAADGQIALHALALDPNLGVVILDLMMPVMDGPTFLEHKARSSHASTPVVIFSSSPCVGLEGFAGVVSVVPKVDGIESLLVAIRNAESAAPVSYAQGL